MRVESIREMVDSVPELDFVSGYRYFLGNFENYIKALMSTLKSIKSKLPLMQRMNFTEEYEGLRNITQTLRIMLSSIGANEIADATYQMEAAVLNDDSKYIREQLPYYIISLIELSDHLESLLKKMDVKNVIRCDENGSSRRHYDITDMEESSRLSSDMQNRKII